MIWDNFPSILGYSEVRNSGLLFLALHGLRSLSEDCYDGAQSASMRPLGAWLRALSAKTLLYGGLIGSIQEPLKPIQARKRAQAQLEQL